MRPSSVQDKYFWTKLYIYDSIIYKVVQNSFYYFWTFGHLDNFQKSPRLLDRLLDNDISIRINDLSCLSKCPKVFSLPERATL